MGFLFFFIVAWRIFLSYSYSAGIVYVGVFVLSPVSTNLTA
jgi:hypothetical protein